MQTPHHTPVATSQNLAQKARDREERMSLAKRLGSRASCRKSGGPWCARLRRRQDTLWRAFRPVFWGWWVGCRPYCAAERSVEAATIFCPPSVAALQSWWRPRRRWVARDRDRKTRWVRGGRELKKRG